MVSLETVVHHQATSRSIDDSSSSSPRISFSSDTTNHQQLLDHGSNLFISITPKSPHQLHKDMFLSSNDPDFEFGSTQSTLDSSKMVTADELFAEGKLLPFWQVQKLNAITLKTEQEEEVDLDEGGGGGRQNNVEAPATIANGCSGWFMEEDPSPRPPNCTVLFKELLRLKKQRRAATLSPSSSSSSTSSSSSSLGDVAGEKNNSNSSSVKRVKKGSSLERTRSATIRIRPMVNVPICTAVKTTKVLPPLFPTKKGRLDR